MRDQKQSKKNEKAFIPLVPSQLNQYVLQLYEKLHTIDIYYSNKIYSFTQQYTLLRYFSKGFAKFSDVIALPLFFFFYWQVQAQAPFSFFVWLIGNLAIHEKIIKGYFHRKRPITAGAQKGLSFPSSHAFVSGVVIATCLFIPLPFAAMLLPIALINIINRPAVGVHYLADVIAGSCLGFIIGIAWIFILRTGVVTL